MITKQEALDKFHKRELSWSSIASFEWNKEEWFEKYILGVKPEETPEMAFGKDEGKKMELDTDYLPMVPRYGKDEYEFRIKFNGIKLVGYADSFNPITWNQLGERKTGEKAWDQKRVNAHGQLDMYLLMNYIQNRINPQDVEITLTWLPTKRTRKGHFGKDIAYVEPIEQNIRIFNTKRTMTHVRKFGMKLIAVHKEMEDYIIEKLSTA